MEGCREVKGREEDEQCGAGEILQPCKNSQTLKFQHCFKNSLPSATPAKKKKKKTKKL